MNELTPVSRKNFPWNDEYLMIASNMYMEGFTARKVAEEMTRISGVKCERYAVIGKMHRHSIPHGNPDSVPELVAAAPPEPEPEPFVPFDLEEYHCRWSTLDEPQCTHGGFGNPARAQPTRMKYCAHHNHEHILRRDAERGGRARARMMEVTR